MKLPMAGELAQPAASVMRGRQLVHGDHKATEKKYRLCFLANDMDVPMNVGSLFRIGVQVRQARRGNPEGIRASPGRKCHRPRLTGNRKAVDRRVQAMHARFPHPRSDSRGWL